MDAQTELSMVADCLGTHPVIGDQATKQQFLAKLPDAEIIHIGQY